MTTGSSSGRCPLCGSPYQVSPDLFFARDEVAVRCPRDRVIMVAGPGPASAAVALAAGISSHAAAYSYRSDTSRAAA